MSLKRYLAFFFLMTASIAMSVLTGIRIADGPLNHCLIDAVYALLFTTAAPVIGLKSHAVLRIVVWVALIMANVLIMLTAFVNAKYHFIQPALEMGGFLMIALAMSITASELKLPPWIDQFDLQ